MPLVWLVCRGCGVAIKRVVKGIEECSITDEEILLRSIVEYYR